MVHNTDEAEKGVSHQAYEHIPSIGKEFRDQRNARNLSIEQVSVDLHIDKRFIKAIEDDDYLSIGKRVFICGYVRNYARYLDMDQDLVLEMLSPFIENIDRQPSSLGLLDSDIGSAEALDYKKAQLNLGSRVSSKHSGLLTLWIALALIFLLVAAGTIGYMYMNKVELNQSMVETSIRPAFEPLLDKDKNDSDATVQSLPRPVFAEEELAVPNTDGDSNNADQSSAVDREGALVEKDVLVDASQAQSETTVPIEENLPPQTRGEAENAATVQTQEQVEVGNDKALVNEGDDELLFVLNEKCWIEVRRLDGSVVVSRLFQTGENPLLRVIMPVDVIIGNVAGVSVFVNGTSVNIDNYANSNVARLRVPS